MQCDLIHVHFQLVQTLFFIEINPNTTYILQTKEAHNEMINFNFIFATLAAAYIGESMEGHH